jgi:hypothetical protein
MARFVLERQYMVPIYEQLIIEACSLEDACRKAADESIHSWSRNARPDYENARAITITQAVELPLNMCCEPLGEGHDSSELCWLLYRSGLPLLAMPAEFAEAPEPDAPIGFG